MWDLIQFLIIAYLFTLSLFLYLISHVVDKLSGQPLYIK